MQVYASYTINLKSLVILFTCKKKYVVAYLLVRTIPPLFYFRTQKWHATQTMAQQVINNVVINLFINFVNFVNPAF